MTSRHLIHPWRALLVGAWLVVAACGSSSDVQADAAVDAGAPDATDTCMGVGNHCAVTGECTGQLTCYTASDHGICAVSRPSCGGFLGTMCSAGFTCVYLKNATLGLCVTVAELTCICSHSPADLQGC